jgi:hypothetical protein
MSTKDEFDSAMSRLITALESDNDTCEGARAIAARAYTVQALAERLAWERWIEAKKRTYPPLPSLHPLSGISPEAQAISKECEGNV